MAQATWNGQVIAQADDEDVIHIEGNSYFPPQSLETKFYEDSDYTTHCPWKGEATYYDIVVDGERNQAGAWHYAQPKEGSAERVGEDFTDYVAFWNGVEIS